ncbi:MAG: RHS repeat protein [Chloroflexaceae bacterium]|nr:RHS repeat protein [Chloroflexaceae bacterium]
MKRSTRVSPFITLLLIATILCSTVPPQLQAGSPLPSHSGESGTSRLAYQERTQIASGEGEQELLARVPVTATTTLTPTLPVTATELPLPHPTAAGAVPNTQQQVWLPLVPAHRRTASATDATPPPSPTSIATQPPVLPTTTPPIAQPSPMPTAMADQYGPNDPHLAVNNPCLTAPEGTICIPITDDANDAYYPVQAGCTGDTSDASNEVYFGHCTDGETITAGFRFENVPIASADEVIEAYLEPVGDPIDQFIALVIAGDASTQPQTFRAAPLSEDNRTLTTATINWYPLSVWPFRQRVQSPDIAPILREIIGTPGWRTHMSDIVLIIKPNGPGTTHRRVFDFRRTPEFAARLVIYTQTTRPPYPPDQNNPPEQCPRCDEDVPGSGPINSRHGNLWTTAVDLRDQQPGLPLVWSRTYDSRKTDPLTSSTQLITTTLGVGWQHAFQTSFVRSAEGPHTHIVITPKGNRHRFIETENGTFIPVPGVFATLTYNTLNQTYEYTLPHQTTYVYDAQTGRLQAQRDDMGHTLLFHYNTQGYLTTIYDPGYGSLTASELDAGSLTGNTRHLRLAYTEITLLRGGSSVQLEQVTDHTGRQVRYTYTNMADLEAVSDVMGRSTTYHYQQHLLTAIINPLGQIEEQTEYEMPYLPTSRAISQTLLDGRHLAITYRAQLTVITTTGRDGLQEVTEHIYDVDHTLLRVKRDGVTVRGAWYDTNYAPGTRIDGNGNATTAVINDQGQPTQVTNALNETTLVEYDDRQRPVVMTDTLQRRTELEYDAHGNLLRQTTGITTAFPLGLTTRYTYTQQNQRWVIAYEQSPDGVVTAYETNAFGHVLAITRGWNLAADQPFPTAPRTAYEYDPLGRQTAVTVGVGSPFERRDVTEYNADGTVARTIMHYVDGVFVASEPSRDIPTTYGYDALGRQVWSRDVFGRYTVTRYNAQGQVAWTAQHFVDPSFDPAAPDATLPTVPPPYDPAILTRTWSPAIPTMGTANLNGRRRRGCWMAPLTPRPGRLLAPRNG